MVKIKLVNMVKRELEDMKNADKCHNCCMCCEKYNTVKEQNKECEARKARGRIIHRGIRTLNKL